MVEEKKVRQGKDASRTVVSRNRGPQEDVIVSGALRTAYEETVREAIPPDFLDLLGKLS